MAYMLTRAKRAAAEAVCRPGRFSELLNNNFNGILTRSLTRALAILKPQSCKKNRRCARIRARRQTTGSVRPARRTERRAQTIGYLQKPYYCVCRGPDIGTLMVMCEEAKCNIKWYHVACLKEDLDLDSTWICSFCR